jgi:hypothetical protein
VLISAGQQRKNESQCDGYQAMAKAGHWMVTLHLAVLRSTPPGDGDWRVLCLLKLYCLLLQLAMGVCYMHNLTHSANTCIRSSSASLTMCRRSGKGLLSITSSSACHLQDAQEKATFRLEPAQQGAVYCGHTDCSAGAMLSNAPAVLNWLGARVSLNTVAACRCSSNKGAYRYLV